MSSTYGCRFRFTIFGQSHSPAIGVTVEGIPAGLSIDLDRLHAFLSRRAPGSSKLSTARKEADVLHILSGLKDGRTCGAPLTAVIENTDARSADYTALRDCPRPGHADYPAQVKFGGAQDPAGGGHFSGRMTAPLCIAGGICLQLLEQMGITVAAHIRAIGTAEDAAIDPVLVSKEQLQTLLRKPFPVLDDTKAEQMEKEILSAAENHNSVGGILECAAVGVPAGWGDPMFYGMENRIAQAVFGIPAIRGIEFGTGFAAAAMTGSTHNDPYYLDNGTVKTKTNHHGGILGGITTGMPIVFRAAVKPTPSIALPQDSIRFSDGAACKLEITGRHDPCIVPRAVPVMEAAAAVALYDAYLCSL